MSSSVGNSVQFPFDPATAAANPDLANAQLDYLLKQQQLSYNQDLAKSLLAESQSPYSSGVAPRGMAYRVSPWEGIAKVVQGGLGAYIAKDNLDQGQANLKALGLALKNAASRNQQPGGGTQPAANTQPNGGMVQGNNTGAPQDAASISTRLETGFSDPMKGLSTIASDTGGSKSYGNFGLNSLRGNSAWQFRDTYGSSLGITADPGTAEFNKQWQAAAANNPQGLRQAELAWYNQNILGPASQQLQSIGLPPQIASDPRVQAYFADRSVQQGPQSIQNHAGRIGQAWQAANGDPVQFLRAMTQSDLQPSHWQNDFQHAIASGVYGERGNTARVTGRLEGALNVQPQNPAVQPTINPFQPGGPSTPQALGVALAGSLQPAGPAAAPQAVALGTALAGPQAAAPQPQRFAQAQPVVQPQPQQRANPWSIPGVPEEQAKWNFQFNRQGWNQMMAAAIRANTPTPVQKNLQGAGLSQSENQRIQGAAAMKEAGTVNAEKGYELVRGADGQLVELPIAGAAGTASQMQAAEAAAKKLGETSGGYPADINQRAEHATGMLRTLSEMQNLNTNPGFFAGAKEDIGKVMRSFGASDATIRAYLKVSPGDLEASQKLTAQMAVEAVKQIGSRPTQMEFQRFLEANPNIFMTPEGLKRVTEFMRKAANDTVNEQAAFLQAKRAGLRPEEYSDFPAIYNQMRARNIAAGRFNSTPAQPAAPQAAQPAPAPGASPQAASGAPVKVNTPQEAAALPSGTQFITPDGRVKVRP